MLTLLLLALAAETGFSLFLSWRQAAHVRRHRDAVPGDFAASVPLAAHRKAADYTVARLRVGAVQQVVDLGVACAWLLGGLDLLYGGLAGWIGAGLGRSVAFVVAYGAINGAIALPFRTWRVFGTESRFGFNRTTPGRYAADLVRGAALSLAMGVPLLFAAFWIMRDATGPWWLYGWAGFTAVTLAMSAAYPRLIAPLFNRFTPLDGALRDRVEALLARCGFHADGLFVMDASRRSSKGNAYFTGLGRNKRIVLFDTLIAGHTEPEIEAVLAHELGHFKHRHILFGTVRFAAVSLAAFACFGVLGRQPWLTQGIGLAHADPALSLVVFLTAFGAIGPFFGLAGNLFSRRAEFQADAFARRMVGAEPLVGALVKLTRDSAGTLTPDPLYALFAYSHPPVPVRVRQLRAG